MGGHRTRRWRFGGRVLIAAVAALASALVAVPPTPAAAADVVLTVNDTGDSGDANTSDGTCRTGSGTCTLRAAIEQANANPGPNTINFAIPGGGPHTIQTNSELLLNDRTGGTTIDGYSQSGSSPNTSARGSNADIRISIVGSTSMSESVLRISSAGNVITGLAFRNGVDRIELRGEDADGNRIQGNFIGFDPFGNQSDGRGSINYGILMHLGPDRNLIGGPDLADRNIISGNGGGSGGGIRVNHGETSQNIIENNVVGLSPNEGAAYRQGIGIDIQWWSWGNLIHNNVVSGHENFGIDLSHSTVNNTVTDNMIGTLGDGDTTTNYTGNYWSGIALKDYANGSHISGNVVMGGANPRSSRSYYGLYGRHDYNPPNTIVDNRFGVGRNGNPDSSFTTAAMLVNGWGDLIQDNVLANDNGLSPVAVVAFDGGAPNYPRHPTEHNRISQNVFRTQGTSNPLIDLSNRSLSGWVTAPHNGFTSNDSGDADSGPNDLLNHPDYTGLAPGWITGTVCAGCEVEVYAQSGADINWIGRVQADGSGRWGLASSSITAGTNLWSLAIDADGNTSETRQRFTVQSGQLGTQTVTPVPSQPRTSVPAPPARPPAWVPDVFTCSWSGGTLSWDDEGAGTYYVRTVDDNGVDSYFGAVSGTSTTVPDAGGYRVINWAAGYARTADCAGPGDPGGPVPFTCSYAAGTLSWSDVGASTYYVRTVDAAGSDSYFGSSTGTSLDVPAASSYQVIHWASGRKVATCPGPGEPAAFTCSYANGTLSWTDVDVPVYYVRTVDAGGSDSYFGSSTGTSLAVPSASSYQVIHWVGGRNVATCPGGG